MCVRADVRGACVVVCVGVRSISCVHDVSGCDLLDVCRCVTCCISVGVPCAVLCSMCVGGSTCDMLHACQCSVVYVCRCVCVCARRWCVVCAGDVMCHALCVHACCALCVM